MHPREGSLAERAGRKHLREQVPDPALRAKLTPRYRIGCKRTLISNEYYPALQHPNVEVVTDSIAQVTPYGIVTADGAEREVDTIILGTGFHVTDMPVAEWVHGRGGRTLDDVWRGSPQAYLGSTISGFPNMFMLVGPNTGLGHNSLVFMIESQLNYVIDWCIAPPDRAGWGRIRRPTRGYAEQLQRGGAAQAGRQRLELGRVRQLVSGRARSQLDDLAGLDLAVPPTHTQLRSRLLAEPTRPRTTAGAARAVHGRPAYEPAPAPADRLVCQPPTRERNTV